MAIQIKPIEPFWRNAVVVRDMRVRLRGPRAFWNQAFYLGLLSLIALGGYGTAVTATGAALDPVQIQNSLATFYYFIFETIAVLILLIAPALTAVSVVFERQRLTLDLLVTTPMTSMQMLVGKLVSSIAFLLLLLTLSIPASALCVILGGATIGDVFRIYALLATDGVILAALGLVFSCTTKNSVQAISGTYAAVFFFAVLTAMLGSTMGASGVFARMTGAGGVSVAPPLNAIAVLNPILAVTAPGLNVSVMGLSLPVWLVAAVFAVLIVRLLLTGAALRLGLYGSGLIASLRRQILLVTSAILFVTAESAGTILSSGAGADAAFYVCVGIVLAAFCVSTVFLPALFVPVVDEEAPVAATVAGRYSFRAAFNGEHAGALPYFHLWLLCAVAATVLGLCAPAGSIALSFGPTGMPGTASLSAPDHGQLIAGALASLVYISGLGFLFWCICRRAAAFCASFTMARPIAFVIFLFLLVAPFAVMAVDSQFHSYTYSLFDNPVNDIWLAFPFSDPSVDTGTLPMEMRVAPFVWTTALCYTVGLLFYLPWKPVTPGRQANARREELA